MSPTRISDHVGRVVGDRYRLVAPLGAGASAQVFLADDVRLERQVAVKMLQPALADDERFLRRFRAEARTVAAISHPNVVVVHDWGDDEVPYLVTEYLAGGSLRAMLQAGRTLSPSQALVVALEVCRGLAHAHAAGLVHRDLKPANLLFDTSGRLRIADFGLARAIAEAAVTEPEGAVVGTARYAAPEQARGERLDGKADIYALGLLLVEAVTGEVPFTADTTLGTLMARVDRDLEVPEPVGGLRPAIERAGRLRPEERPDAEELAILLLAASERMDAPAPLPLVGALEEGRAGTDGRDLTRTDIVALPLDETRFDERPVAAPLPAAVDPAVVPESAVAPDEARSGRRRRWPLVLAALLLLAAGAAAFLAFDTLRTPEYTVPSVIGEQLGDLELVAVQNDWVLEPKKTRRNGTAPGEIVSTDPPPGEQLAEGGTLVVVVSEGNELTDVPTELVGRPLPEVVADLEAARLGHEVVEEVFDEEVPDDHVLRIADELGEREPEGTVVPLVVSMGPEPRTVPTPADGDGYERVAAALEAVQLVPVRAEEHSDTVPLGHVIRLSPAAGEQAARGDEVTVVVSRGPQLVPVPDVRGQSLEQAEASLEAAGLRLGQILGSNKGKVLYTDPPPGESVRKGTEVNVLTSR